LFTNRIANIWNRLPNAVMTLMPNAMMPNAVDLFKSRLDNFGMSEDVKYV